MELLTLLFHRWPFTTGTCPRHSRMLEAGRMRPLYSGLKSMQMCSSGGWGTRWSFGSRWTSPLWLLTKAMAMGQQLQVKVPGPVCQLFSVAFLSPVRHEIQVALEEEAQETLRNGLRFLASCSRLSDRQHSLPSDTTFAKHELHMLVPPMASFLCSVPLTYIRWEAPWGMWTDWWGKGPFIRPHRSRSVFCNSKIPKFWIIDLADLSSLWLKPIVFISLSVNIRKFCCRHVSVLDYGDVSWALLGWYANTLYTIYFFSKTQKSFHSKHTFP